MVKKQMTSVRKVVMVVYHGPWLADLPRGSSLHYRLKVINLGAFLLFQ